MFSLFWFCLRVPIIGCVKANFTALSRCIVGRYIELIPYKYRDFKKPSELYKYNVFTATINILPT